MPIHSLNQLSLDDAERVAVRSNGFIACEQRRYSRVYKLRFRVQGQQRVRYLGIDPAAAELLQKELAVWQAGPRAERALREAERNARQAIREIKSRLEPDVVAAGLKFHGRTIRRPRRRPSRSGELT